MKYNFINTGFLIDEISMTGKGTFDQLDTNLQLIKNHNLDFGGVYVLVISVNCLQS